MTRQQERRASAAVEQDPSLAAAFGTIRGQSEASGLGRAWLLLLVV